MGMSDLLIVLSALVFGILGYFLGWRRGLMMGQLFILHAIPVADRQQTIKRARELLGVEEKD